MRYPCKWCGGLADPDSVCPRSIECPSCRAQPGESCRRPSGHRAPELHAARTALAEQEHLRPTDCVCDPTSYVTAVCRGHDRLDCPANPHNPALAAGDSLPLFQEASS